MVPIIEQDSILFLGYSFSYKEYTLTGFSHQKNHYSLVSECILVLECPGFKELITTI